MIRTIGTSGCPANEGKKSELSASFNHDFKTESTRAFNLFDTHNTTSDQLKDQKHFCICSWQTILCVSAVIS